MFGPFLVPFAHLAVVLRKRSTFDLGREHRPSPDRPWSEPRPPTTSILLRPEFGSEHVIDHASTEAIAGEDRTAEVHSPINPGIVNFSHHICERCKRTSRFRHTAGNGDRKFVVLEECRER